MATPLDDPRLLDRFWRKVAIAGADDCWEWTAGRFRKGYAQFTRDGKGVYAHRISFEIANGPIPDGMQVDHTCRNRGCINPSHLRLATPKQNCENLSVARNNKSGFRGVSWQESSQRWRVTVFHNRKSYHGGLHAELEDAVRASIELRNRLFTHNVESPKVVA